MSDELTSGDILILGTVVVLLFSVREEGEHVAAHTAGTLTIPCALPWLTPGNLTSAANGRSLKVLKQYFPQKVVG